ncbi:MAG: hypothetical protein MR327_06525 [Clostridiales bacterium]|nr:hypothetical protein [Clostridiales bacterium]
MLAVLASPPYFADLLDRDDLSGNYPESTTSYSSSTGSGGGSTGSTTISVGAYVSYEQDIKIFGVTVASWEAEATITAGFTWETEHTSTLEQTVTYSATSGEDKVAFYSIPMEIYEYTSYVPDGKGGYDKVITALRHNNMDPGNYTVTPCPSGTTPADLYQNYTVTYVSGTYTVIGLTYRLSVEAQKYTDKAGSRIVGSAGISATGTTVNHYSANTVVQLYAQPNDGYMVDHWTVKYGDTAEQTLYGDPNNPNRLTITTEAAPTEVKVYFKVKPILLTATTDKGGRVDCTDDENFTSGANVSSGAEFTFKAVPAEGYHFFGWQLGVEGTSTTYPAGTDNGDGTNRLNIKVGTNSIALKAVFQRDSYTLTLEGDITAHYLRQDPANPTGPQIETTIVSGASIPGDTEITAQPKTGYQAAEGAEFILNGEATGQSDSYTFSLTANSVLSLDTQRNRYSITATADDDSHGSVSVLVGGQPAQGDALSAVEGGSVITFIAKAERGYHFDRWTVNETNATESGGTLTVGALGQNMAVTANFAASKGYTATGIVSHDSRGTMLYTLYDIYGNVVDEAESEMSDPLTLYEGESILFKVKTNSGYMVEQWDCNGSATVSTAKTYPAAACPPTATPPMWPPGHWRP